MITAQFASALFALPSSLKTSGYCIQFRRQHSLNAVSGLYALWQTTHWLQLDDDAHMIMVRQYSQNLQGKQLAQLAIRNLDAPDHQAPGENAVDSLPKFKR